LFYIYSENGIYSNWVCNQATGYASQHIWCLSKSRINWKGCIRKGIRRKNSGDGRDWGILSGWGGSQSGLLVVCLGYLHFALENAEDGEQRYDIWVSPRGHPHMLKQTGGGETQPECSTTLC